MERNRNMLPDYTSSDTIKNHFAFLESWGFVLKRQEDLNYGSYLEYIGNGVKVYLGFDFREYHFFFSIYRKDNMGYSDAAVGKDIRSFCDLALKYVPGFDCRALQPNRTNKWKPALENNAQILEKYGKEILTGKVWFEE